jgi:hypothetical protein
LVPGPVQTAQLLHLPGRAGPSHSPLARTARDLAGLAPAPYRGPAHVQGWRALLPRRGRGRDL